LPLLVLPFGTLLFWALGGGKTIDLQAQQQILKQGMNLELPNANLKEDKPLDKLSYYEKAASDSAKLEAQMKNDPNYIQQSREDRRENFINDSIVPTLKYKHGLSNKHSNLKTSLYGNHSSSDSNEAKVYKKLEELNKAMNQAEMQSNIKSSSYSNKPYSRGSSMKSGDMAKLEQMMEMNKKADENEDPEMKQLNGMMEKILDIQHPERVKEKIKQASETHKGQVFAVNVNSNKENNSLITNSNSILQSTPSINHFYSLDQDSEDTSTHQNAIKAVIHASQILVDGSIVKLRLLNDVYINGILIPKDNFLFGTASVSGERLKIKINSIRYKSSLYTVDLSVFDLDGMDGIYIPGAITRDVAKQSAVRAVQGIGFTSLDPSLKVQAATAGIEAAKTLISKKTKLVKVTVKAGYQVLLSDNKQ
ncbi:MAG: conjugative transposon protein TraM, partial [Segetibacter sp.]